MFIDIGNNVDIENGAIDIGIELILIFKDVPSAVVITAAGLVDKDDDDGGEDAVNGDEDISV